jgi:mannose-6-phosphate isomerase-like protein (cupin superfamily)
MMRENPASQNLAAEPRRQVSLQEALAKLPGEHGERFVSLFTHGSLQIEIYQPRGVDPQQPHTRDEVYVVVQGEGEYVCEGVRHVVGPGDFLFAAAGEAHRFERFTDDLAVWVMFYGPQGGEADSDR